MIFPLRRRRPPVEILRPGDNDYLTSRERAKADQAEIRAELRRARLAAGGATAAWERRGLVRGMHYTEWVEPFRQLKRDGKVDEALELALECIAAAERDAPQWDGVPAPAYTEWAAIIYRQRKDYASEVGVLERYRATCPPKTTDAFSARLAKACALLARSGG